MTTLLDNDKVAISCAGPPIRRPWATLLYLQRSRAVGAAPSHASPGTCSCPLTSARRRTRSSWNGALIPDGAVDFPIVAARYPFMVSTDLVLPDLRGRFVRGWDHGAGMVPDAAGRLPRAGDGAGA